MKKLLYIIHYLYTYIYNPSYIVLYGKGGQELVNFKTTTDIKQNIFYKKGNLNVKINK